MGDMGQAWSGVFASEALRLWRPANVIQLGIAGSLVGTKRPLGDVIIPGEVVGYEIGEAVEEPDRAPYRFKPTGKQADFALLGSARALCNDSQDYVGWQDRALNASAQDLAAAEEAARRPSVHIGKKEVLASGNFVVKSKKFAEQLRREVHPDLRAAEMEAKGLFDAIVLATEATAALMVRGVSDYAGGDKEATELRTGGAFRRAAVRSAALFLADLIDRRMRDADSSERTSDPLRLTPTLSRRGSAAAREHGLEIKGANSGCLVLDPLLKRSSGTPELTSLRAEVFNAGAPVPEVSMALRQTRAGWTRVLAPVAAKPGSTWTIQRDAEPYTLSFALVADAPISGVRITVEDEFRRVDEWTYDAARRGCLKARKRPRCHAK
jgi:nucleoside phosphorylase